MGKRLLRKTRIFDWEYFARLAKCAAGLTPIGPPMLMRDAPSATRYVCRMLRFLVQRALQSLIVLALMSFVVYGLIGLMPGDPVDLMIGSNPKLTQEIGRAHV